MSLHSLEEKLREKKIADATQNLRDFIESNPEMIPHQIELSKEMDAIGGDDPVTRLCIILHKMRWNIIRLGRLTKEIENGLRGR